MKLIRVIFVLTFFIFIGLKANENEKININFNDLQIMDLIKITSKIIDKNILVTEKINGKVDFISNKSLNQSELIKVLGFALEDKGYTLVENDELIRIVKLSESANSNLPVIYNSKNNTSLYMVTEVFTVNNADVDYIAAKIRHLLSKNGKLVTNKETNSLIISDFKDNIDTVKKVVKVMNLDISKKSVIVKLKNVVANEAKKSLDLISKSKFNEKVETEKVSIVDIKENNSLIIIGNQKNINYLAKYIENLDNQDSLTKREVKVIPLKNVEAKNVIKIIDGIVSKRKYIDEADRPLVSTDEESNSIVAMGPIIELEYINTLLKELDKEKAQVYVQARIIEVNDELVDEIGISYGVFGGEVSSKGLSAFSSSLNGGSDAVSIVTSALSMDIPNITSGLALGASLNLLNQNGALDIVSEPSILAIDNKESSIYVGETISVKTSSSVTDGGTTNENFKREDVGLTLKVKPRISNDNKVTLDINTILEGVKTTQTTSGNADTSKKEVKTTAILNNGESVIIGGLIENKMEKTEQKVPLLGDIPLLGELFKNSVNNNKKNNLVVIITPYLIPKSKDITYVRNQLSQLKFLEDRYLEQSLIRLKNERLKRESETKKNKEIVKKLDENLTQESEHERRVREMLDGWDR